ncbi:acyl-CoA dehydrogenase family protein [Aquihabitans sp. McL0605]|uniref:acyl-CoA dehydrogenase family protein n=1 Tax=Aquihabitans sp. McL0605 TaxID=3415671 RepID=UPI003CE850A3
MDLDFSEEQEMLREMVRGVCSTSASLESVRALEDDPTGFSPEFWAQLAELDLTGLMIPEEYGGSGMTALEGAVVYEEFGRALAPSPHFVSAVLSAGLILRSGSDAQKQEWLPQIAKGDAIFTTAWLEPKGGFGPKGVRAQATADGDGWVLTGTKWHVPFAAAASKLVVLARTGEGIADVDLFVVDPAAGGVELTQMFSIASDCQYQLQLDSVAVTAADRIGAAGTGWATWDAVLTEGLVFLAAQAIGGAAYALEITVQYAKDREQFDKPLGAFQAISHYLADAATAVNGGRILAYEAAWAISDGRSVDSLAPMAKLFACQTYRNTTAMGEQVFGGVGFTLEYDIQLYFRRAKALQISWLDDNALSERVAVQVLDQPA